ncbi:hypothetical protein Btru_065480 [Bulinus truncatus]|nr:hypothetical protein Btru_065480 [Bulinus truncatus]
MTSNSPHCGSLGPLGRENRPIHRERHLAEGILGGIHAELKHVDRDLQGECLNSESATIELKPDPADSHDVNYNHAGLTSCNYVIDGNISAQILDQPTPGGASGAGAEQQRGGLVAHTGGRAAGASQRREVSGGDGEIRPDSGFDPESEDCGNVRRGVTDKLTQLRDLSADEVITECQAYLLNVRNDVLREKTRVVRSCKGVAELSAHGESKTWNQTGRNSDYESRRLSHQHDVPTSLTIDSNSTFFKNGTDSLYCHGNGRYEPHSGVLKQLRLTSNGASPLTDLPSTKQDHPADTQRDADLSTKEKLLNCVTKISRESHSVDKRRHRQTYPLSLFLRWEKRFHSVFIEKHPNKVHQEKNELTFWFGDEDEDDSTHISHSDSNIVGNHCKLMDGDVTQLNGAAPKIAPSHIKSNILYETNPNGIGVVRTFTTPQIDVDRKSIKPDASCTHRLLNFALAYLWVGPLVSVYWCNSWHLPEYYLLPPDPEISSWISGAIGYTIYFLGYLLQDVFVDFAAHRRRPVQWATMHLYTYVMCWGNVNQWRCVWVLLDVYTGAHLLNAALSCVLASAVLLLMRAHRVTAAAPSTVRMDLPLGEHFKMMTYFKATTGKWPRVADCLFTVIVVDTVGVALWRGLWEVMDFALIPEDKTMSGVWTLVISYSLAILMCLTQDLVKNVSIGLEDKHWIVSLAFEDFITVLHSTVTICHWRGFWTLMDVYMPFRPVSHWIGHLVSFVLLAGGMAGTSIPVLGLVRDGRVVKGEGIVFDHYYFTHLYEFWVMKKPTHQLNVQEESQSPDELSTATITTFDGLLY